MNTKILVAAHKDYVMPANQELYMPIHVGTALHPEVKLSFQGDDTGDNISLKNAHYNELTALYWGWKNLKDIDALGLVHYRRYLSMNRSKDLTKILNQQQVDQLLAQYDIILPKKRHYYIESNYQHYVRAHHSEPLDLTRQIIARDYPAYLASFDKVMARRSAHMFNMMIMKKQPLNEYCTWLFDILGKVEAGTDISDYDQYEARVYGFVSELLLDVWLDQHPVFKTHEVNFVYMEKQNWFVKGGNFLRRHFISKK